MFSLIILLVTPVLAVASPVTLPDLVSLNQSCQGRLFTASPLARPCFSVLNGENVLLEQAQCSIVQANYTSGEFRAAHYSGFMQDYGETCAASVDSRTAQCLIDPDIPLVSMAAPSNASCGQGSISPHYVKISCADDVKATFAYAQRTKQTLSIKNSGHDYLGRSSLKGSLALWTRHLDNMGYNPNFIAQGCAPDTQTHAAMTLGAGVNMNQAYIFADKNNATFVGGSSPTVGASGGFIMTGGHGLLSSQFGLAIDRVLEYKIVTPTGDVQTANACQNQDLFWALRGGGGGTFGVVLESTSKVEPRLDLVFSLIELPANFGDTRPFTKILMDNAVKWSLKGWGGPNSPASLAMVNPFLSFDDARASMEPLASYVSSVGGTVVLEQHSNFLSVYMKYILPAANLGIASAFIATNRMVPTTLLDSVEGKTKVQEYLSELQAAGFDPTIFQTTPTYYQSKGHYQEGSTSATPAWRNSVWMITGNTHWAWNATVSDKQAIVRKVQAMTEAGQELAADSGSYTSEADPWTVEWRDAWWGTDNYNKLRLLKTKFDPLGLLTCWKCIGWEEYSGQEGQPFACMGGLND